MSQEELGARQGVLVTSQGPVPQHSLGQWAVGRHLSAWFRLGKGWLHERLFTFLPALCVIAITIGIFFFRDKIVEFHNYGYLGAFLANLVSNATIFLPVPGGLIVVALGAFLSPFLVGLAAGAGAAVGEMSGYVLGYSGRIVIKDNKAYDRSVQWLKKWGALTVFVFAVTPLPFDLAAIAAGALRFPLWKFLLACWVGKTLLSIAAALAGAWGWKVAVPYFN
jgi:membrane protein YqaA with SNARE-associated domain